MTAPPTIKVRATFERWFEDQLLELGITQDELAERLGWGVKQLSRRLNNPAEFSGQQFVEFARALNKNWCEDIVYAFPKKFKVILDTITINEAIQASREHGQNWELVDHVA